MEQDGRILGWPVSVFGESFPGQGYDLPVAPYAVDDASAPDDVFEVCRQLSDGRYADRRAADRALKDAGFVAE